MDPALISAVIKTESNFNSDLVGMHGERGLMQLLPSSFPNTSINKLKDIRTNVKLGVEYLAKMKKSCVHKVNKTWVVCYNVGVGGARKIKHPTKFPYYIKVMREYARMSKLFKPGQKVAVLRAHAHGAHDFGTIVQESVGREYAGQYLVDLGYTRINIDKDRILTEEEFVELLRSKNGKQ